MTGNLLGKFCVPALCFLLPLVLFLGSPSLFASEGEPENGLNSASTLNRLTGILNQLSTLNEKLRNELQDSKQSSASLQIMLEASKQELGSLKQELGVLRIVSTELLSKAESSQTELTALRETLKKAESSLLSLELSFAAYREASEQNIKRLEHEKKLWKWGCIAASILAAGFGGAMLIGR